jgi:tetratricopeptide (TPR) repeat protein
MGQKQPAAVNSAPAPSAETPQTSQSTNPSLASVEIVYSPVPEANRLFLQARGYFDKGNPSLGGELSDVRKSIELFEAAIAKDPQFALAYAEVSRAWTALGWSAPDGLPNIDLLPHVKATALKAVELDERLPAAHLALASVYSSFEFDWARAEAEYKRAIELAPSDARGYAAYAVYLGKMGRFSEALTRAQRASELGQTGATDRMFMFIYYAMRRFDLAEQYGLSASRKDDNFLSHMFLGFTYLQEHKYSQGITEFEEIRTRGTGGLAGLAYAYAVGGRKADALLVLKQCNTNEEVRAIVPYRIAAVYLVWSAKIPSAFESRQLRERAREGFPFA